MGYKIGYRKPASVSVPWERQTDDEGNAEPMLWYGRFRIFLRLGRDRSLLAAYNAWRVSKGKAPRSAGTTERWTVNCARWHWRDRADAYDAEQDRITQARYEARQAELREQEWQDSQALRERAEQMLKFPLATVERVSEDGHTTVTMLPVRWRAADIARYAEMASKLGRLSTGMVTDQVREELSAPGGAPLYDVPTLTKALLAARKALDDQHDDGG